MLLSLILASATWAQEDAPAGDVEEPETTESGETGETGDSGEVGETEEPDDADAADELEAIVDADFEDTALDEQTYEEDDDDFIPSEEIPADEPIPFPSNI